MRNAINNLQAVHISYGMVNKDNVYKVCDVPSKELTIQMIERLLQGDLDQGLNTFESLWGENYCLHDLVVYLARSIEHMENLTLDLRMEMMVLCGRLKMSEAEGVMSKTQIVGFLARICRLGLIYNNAE